MSAGNPLQQIRQRMNEADKWLERIVVELAHAVAVDDDERIDRAARDLRDLQDHRRDLYDDFQQLRQLQRLQQVRRARK